MPVTPLSITAKLQRATGARPASSRKPASTNPGELRQVRESLVVKQDELTRLSRDNEHLIGEHANRQKPYTRKATR